CSCDCSDDTLMGACGLALEWAAGGIVPGGVGAPPDSRVRSSRASTMRRLRAGAVPRFAVRTVGWLVRRSLPNREPRFISLLRSAEQKNNDRGRNGRAAMWHNVRDVVTGAAAPAAAGEQGVVAWSEAGPT